MHLSIIVVSWNVRPYLLDCLDSIFGQRGDEFSLEVICVDNGSTDATVEGLRALRPEVRIIENSENIGFAAANNQGIRLAQGKFVLLLNPDTIVLDNTLDCLLGIMLHNPQVGVLAPQLLNEDGSVQPSVMRFPSLLSSIQAYVRARIHGASKAVPPDEGKDVSYVECISGACLLVRQEVFRDVGLLDESYVMYGEDIDFCYRVNRRGWKVGYTRLGSIVHFGEQSARQDPERMYVERRRSRVRFLLSHRGRFHAALAALLIEANLIVRCVGSLARHRQGTFPQILSLYHRSVCPMLFER